MVTVASCSELCDPVPRTGAIGAVGVLGQEEAKEATREPWCCLATLIFVSAWSLECSASDAWMIESEVNVMCPVGQAMLPSFESNFGLDVNGKECLDETNV